MPPETSQYQHPDDVAPSTAEIDAHLAAASRVIVADDDDNFGRPLGASESVFAELHSAGAALGHTNAARQPHNGRLEEPVPEEAADA